MRVKNCIQSTKSVLRRKMNYQSRISHEKKLKEGKYLLRFPIALDILHSSLQIWSPFFSNLLCTQEAELGMTISQAPLLSDLNWVEAMEEAGWRQKGEVGYLRSWLLSPSGMLSLTTHIPWPKGTDALKGPFLTVFSVCGFW